ncbi:hypothetical protein Taro_052806 [Colocasia esculenta]|uniref:Uncharacterized protein n=1 Tax=Colocasia esculenta TaxID=4460 RepID=A0A843XLB1_COLES|nr:hypothetical protein [Colocasia esculenta]
MSSRSQEFLHIFPRVLEPPIQRCFVRSVCISADRNLTATSSAVKIQGMWQQIVLLTHVGGDICAAKFNKVRLPDCANCPDDMVHLSPSRVTYPIAFNSRCREPSSNARGGGSASWTPAMLDFWCTKLSNFTSKQRRYMFTRPEYLPQALVVWESTAQTNFRKLMWEAQDKETKTTGSQDLTAWMDYGPVWMRRDYWESLCHRWATRPWQERSQVAKRNRVAHPEKNVYTSGYELERAPTFCELFDRTHKRKGTDDYVSESARMIVNYDRRMADRYVEGTPQPDLDPEAWVDAVGGPRKG